MNENKGQNLSISTRHFRMASGPELSAIVLVLAVLAAGSVQAQTYTVLYSFAGHGDGIGPEGIVRDAIGNLYGTTSGGGAFGFGTVFKLDNTDKETVLHSFTGGDGLGPNQGMVRGADGNLYGTTYEGGTPEGGGCEYGCGTVFKVDTAGKETVLYAFAGGKKAGSPAGIVRDPTGGFYGIADGGSSGNGVVFELTRSGKFTVLHGFTGADGAYPTSLVLGKKGILYGTARGGGDLSCNQGQGCGVILKLVRKGKGRWKETVLYKFTGGTDGWSPSNLVLDGAGDFYGIAQGGDFNCEFQYGCGIIFELGATGGLSVLHVFAGYPADGSYPSYLSADRSGTLYGATGAGGSSDNCGRDLGCGTLFSLDNLGNQTILYSFSGTDGLGPDDVILDHRGNIYGTTLQGGDFSCGGRGYGGCGVVFKLTPSRGARVLSASPP